MTSTFNTMQTLKRRFFAMRNGLLADQMRRAGSNFRIIFGLNIIQLNEIAADYGSQPRSRLRPMGQHYHTRKHAARPDAVATRRF